MIYLLISKIFHCIISNQYDFLSSLLSVHIKSALSAEIYEKLLRISLSSISQAGENSLSYGKIINLMQVDLDGITSGMINSMDLIILPFTWGIGFYLIFVTIQWKGGVSGVGMTILLMIGNFLLTNKLSKLQKELMVKKDVRLKACNELLGNIRIFKIYN